MTDPNVPTDPAAEQPQGGPPTDTPSQPPTPGPQAPEGEGQETNAAGSDPVPPSDSENLASATQSTVSALDCLSAVTGKTKEQSEAAGLLLRAVNLLRAPTG